MRGDIINLLASELERGGFIVDIFYGRDIVVYHRSLLNILWNFFVFSTMPRCVYAGEAFSTMPRCVYIGEVIVHEDRCVLYRHYKYYKTCTVDFVDLDVNKVIRFFK